MEEKSKKSQKIQYDDKSVRLLHNIRLDMEVKKEDKIILGNKQEVKMSMITQKQLYEDAILISSKDHIYQTNG